MTYPLNLHPPCLAQSVLMLPSFHLHSVYETLHTGALDHLQTYVSPPGFGEYCALAVQRELILLCYR